MGRVGAAWLALVLVAVVAAGCAGRGGRPTVDLAAVEPAPESVEDVELEHLRWILSPDETDGWLAMSADERTDLLRRRWASLDPTPTTPANERRDEHYRRVAYARAYFARERPPGWDERGELLIRYGAPDVREIEPADVTLGRGLEPAREVWIYRGLGAAYELQDLRMNGDYVDAFRRRPMIRPDLTSGHETRRPDAPGESDGPDGPKHHDPDDLAADADIRALIQPRQFAPIDAETQAAKERLAQLVRRGTVVLDDTPQSYVHDYGGERLEFAYDVLDFASPRPGRTRVEVHLAMRAADLGWRAVDGHHETSIVQEAVVKTDDWREIARRESVLRHRRDSLGDVGLRLVLDELRLDLDPGSYRLALAVRDSVTARVGIFETAIDVRAFPPGELAISDVQMALAVEPAREADPDEAFVKGPWRVVPLPMATFPPDRDATLFFEIYGLEPSPTGDRLYSVEFVVRPRTVATSSWFGSSRGRLVPGVGTSFDGRADADPVREWISLDVSTFGSDVYDVEINVVDRVSDRTATTSVAFAVPER